MLKMFSVNKNFGIPFHALAHWKKYLEDSMYVKSSGKYSHTFVFDEHNKISRHMTDEMLRDLRYLGFAEVLPGQYTFGYPWSCNFIMGEKVHRLSGTNPLTLSEALDIVAAKFRVKKLCAISCHSDLIDDSELENSGQFAVPHFGRWIRVDIN